MKKIIICGSRYFDDEEMFLGACWAESPGGMTEKVTWIHGGCPTGADSMTSLLAGEKVIFAANWAKHGKAAGPIRNREMASGGADICLAFFMSGAENRGTINMVKCARSAGIAVKEFWSKKP